MNRKRWRLAALGVAYVAISRVFAQDAPSVPVTQTQTPLHEQSKEGERATTLPNLSEHPASPSPVGDSEKYTYVLVDLLEYQRTRGVDVLRWDATGWHGGDRQRLWFKSEGERYSSAGEGGEADLQALYGKLISPYFDLQAGLRVETHFERTNVSRGFAVLALQGLTPYRFEIEPELFLSNKGKVSMRFKASHEWQLTQRLILQPRAETEIAFQRDESFGVDRGVNDAEAGLRLRYEIRREVAPYAGVSFRQSFGAAKDRVLREGGIPNQLQFVFGLRFWH